MGQAQNTTMISSEKRFSRLQLENVRCFEKVEIPLDARLTIIKVEAKLPDPAGYKREARAFERLSINGKRRQNGFSK